MRHRLTFFALLLPITLSANTGWWFTFGPERINKEVWIEKDEVFCGAVFSPLDDTDTLGRPDNKWPGIWVRIGHIDTMIGHIRGGADTAKVVVNKVGYAGHCIPAWLDSIHGCSQIVVDPDSIKFLVESLFRVVTYHNAIGKDCSATGTYATVSGGRENEASGGCAVVGGGYNNTASSEKATVSGGIDNTASSELATVGGGYANTASGQHATVGGGEDNTASSSWCVTGGGIRNEASDTCATVAGGYENIASGNFATVPGGYDNLAESRFGFAVGYKAKVWGDASDSTSMVLGTGVVDSVPYACIINGDGDDTLSTAHHTLIGTDATVDGSVTATSYSGTSDMYNDSSGLFLRRDGIASLTGDLTVDDVDIRGIETVEADTGIFNQAVGIGTTTPEALLDVNAENAQSLIRISRGDTNLSSSADLGALEFYADYSASPTIYGGIYVGSTAGSGNRASMNFKVKSTGGGQVSGLYLNGTNTGVNVGINTTGPDRKLDVQDASAAQIRGTHTDNDKFFDLEATSTGKFILTSSIDSTHIIGQTMLDSVTIGNGTPIRKIVDIGSYLGFIMTDNDTFYAHPDSTFTGPTITRYETIGSSSLGKNPTNPPAVDVYGITHVLEHTVDTDKSYYKMFRPEYYVSGDLSVYIHWTRSTTGGDQSGEKVKFQLKNLVINGTSENCNSGENTDIIQDSYDSAVLADQIVYKTDALTIAAAEFAAQEGIILELMAITPTDNTLADPAVVAISIEYLGTK